MTEQEQKAFDQMQEVIIKHIEDAIKDHCSGSDLYMSALVAAGKIQAITAANAVSVMGNPITEPVPHSGADEKPPVFGRRWKIAADGFGLQRDDLNGRYIDIDDALSVLHAAHPQATEPNDFSHGYDIGYEAGKLHASQATEPAWRPIESAPKDGTEIIGCWPSYIDSDSFARVTCKYVGWSWVTTDYSETESAQPTYWSPLPAAPEAS